MDKYEIKGRIENVRSMYMPDPQIILGRREGKFELFQGDEPGKRLAQRAIFHAAADAFSEQGYSLSPATDDDASQLGSADYQKKIQTAWKHLEQFTNAGMEKKPKLWPFSLAPDHQGLAFERGVDAIAFVQCYGRFDSVISPDAEVTTQAISAVVQ